MADREASISEIGASRIDRFFGAVERLPGPPELFYAGLGIGIAAVSQIAVWTFGGSWGSLDQEIIETSLIAAFLLGLTHLVTRVARSAFEDFRPALGDSGDIERLRSELTSIPDRVALVVAAITIVIMVGSYLLFVAPSAAPFSPIVEALRAPLWMLVAGAAGLFIVTDIRQLRAVSRMSRTAPRVDIFDATSTNAFSRLTVVGSVSLLLIVALLVVSQTLELTYLLETTVLALVAVATFVLPLQAMHSRLEQEKGRLMSESTARLRTVMSRLNDAVTAGDLKDGDQLDKMLNAVLAERGLLSKLHTWPWSDTTFRGFASALLLPIVIFVITRGIDRLL